ncbi:MAG: type IV secretory system conjugative DNA transfer family protein [Acidiferrobacterales bacterium]
MLSVLMADLAAAALLFHAWQPAAIEVMILTSLVIGMKRARTKIARTACGAWVLGKGVEISDPDHPVNVPVPFVTHDVLNLGMLVIGSPGAGKTDSVMLGHIRALRERPDGGGWAFFDGKGDVDTYKKCVGMGCVPDHFFSSELPGSETVNLFEGKSHDVIDRLSKILIGSTTSTSFYMDEQRAVLARIVPLLRQIPVATNLRDLYVTLCMKDAGNEVMRRAQDADLDPAQITLACQWFEQPFAVRVRNIAGLLNRLFILISGPYADRLNACDPDICIGDVVRRGESVYFHLPLTDFARDVVIAIIETFGVETRNRQLNPAPDMTGYPLLFDDWGAFFHEGFGPFSARCRSARMPLSFGFQSHAQLHAVSPAYADELDDTIATKIIMRVQGEATAHYATRIMGKGDVIEIATRHATAHTESSLHYTRRYRIDERALRELQRGEAYVSTLLEKDGRSTNPLWRVRFRLPDFGSWPLVPMPKARVHAEGAGLGLWGRYMNPEALSEIHRSVERAQRDARVSAAAQNAQSRADARITMTANPGVRTDL